MSTSIAISTFGHPFTAARIDRLINADTVQDAQRMGPIDWILDFFRGGVKREAIAKAFDEINRNCNCAGDAAATTKQFSRIQALLDLVEPEHLDKFKLSAKSGDPINDTCSYVFSAQGVQLASWTGTGHDGLRSLSSVQDAVMLKRIEWVSHNQQKDLPLAKLTEILGQIPEGYAKTHHEAIVSRFFMLAGKLPGHGPDFKIDLDTPLDAHTPVPYRLKLHGQVVHSGDLPRATAQGNYGFSDAFMAGARHQVSSSLDIYLKPTHTLKDWREAAITCMADDKYDQAELSKKLIDPAFASSNFTHYEDAQETFTAHFGSKHLVFCNRSSTQGELRGELLKAQLQGSYANLMGLIDSVYLTKDDSKLIATVNGFGWDIAEKYMDYKSSMADDEYEYLHHGIYSIPAGSATLSDFLPRFEQRYLEEKEKDAAAFSAEFV